METVTTTTTPQTKAKKVSSTLLPELLPERLTDPASKEMQILQLLGQYRFLTTHQLHQRLGNRWLEQTRRQLGRLRKYKLVKSYAYVPERGNHSEKCWLLRQGGAKLVEKVSGQELKYNSHYRRQPSVERIRYREWELELEAQITRAHWQVIRPQTHNQHKPLPDRTPQFYALARALTVIEARNNPAVKPELLGPHSLIAPLKANDYVATSPDGTKAAIFILSPERVSKRFWNDRVKQYRLVARVLTVVGVFSTEEQVLEHHQLLEAHKLKVTTLDRVSKGLSSLK